MKVKKKFVLFLLIYILCFVYSFFFSTVYNDEIWNYGFAYNIASGLVPYRDFNMIVTPLYSLLASVFIKLFGDYLFCFHLFNCIIFASIIYIICIKLGYKGLILVPMVFLNCYPGYNMLCILLMLIIVNNVDKEFENIDFIIGLLIGAMFLTKQTIGTCLLFPLWYFSKNKIKGFIGFLVPVAVFFCYLIFNNALYAFFDYCLFGLFDFGNSNSILFFLPLEIIICLLMLKGFFRSKFQNKSLFFLLMYQIVTVPIFDDYHFMVGLIPYLYYLLKINNIEKYKIKYYIIMSVAFFISWSFKVHEFENLNFYSDSSSFLYMRNIPKYVMLEDIANYIKDNGDVYDHIYVFSKNAYYIKLNANYKIDKYDLINNGNMGYKGQERYIEEIDNYCLSHSCMFILYRYEFESNGNSQTNKTLVSYVKNNYYFLGDVQDGFDIFINE